MIYLALSVIAILLALAALHLYWGVGGFWPGSNAAELVDRAVGAKGRAPPDFVACAVVASLLTIAAYMVAAQHGAPQFGIPHLLWTIGYWGVFAVFLLRGIATYVPAAFAYAKGTSFFDLNRRYYGPLCLAIAAALAISYR